MTNENPEYSISKNYYELDFLLKSFALRKNGFSSPSDKEREGESEHMPKTWVMKNTCVPSFVLRTSEKKEQKIEMFAFVSHRLQTFFF